MATAIVMPSFAMYTAEGVLVRWLHQAGSPVHAGEPLLEIETEKSVNEVVAPADGVLWHALPAGAQVREQELLGYVLADGESAPSAHSRPQLSGVVMGGVGAADETPSHQTKPGPDSADDGRIRASPIARRLAAERGIPLASLKGSGPGGRIVEADVRARAQGPGAEPSADAGGSNRRDDAGRRSPLTSMRRAIGERLRRGLDAAIPVTLTREVAVDQLIATRQALSASLGIRVPFDAMFIKLLAGALLARPQLNGIIEDGHWLTFPAVDIGLAVALPEGLVVPVIRNAARRPLALIAAEVRELTRRARARELRAEDFQGGVSTVTNLGAHGIDSFTPVLNPPQASVLGIGRIAQRPVVKSNRLAVATTCSLCLTFDHRATDGAPAAQLLDELAHRMNDMAHLSNQLAG